jgi:hypothetical protein
MINDTEGLWPSIRQKVLVPRSLCHWTCRRNHPTRRVTWKRQKNAFVGISRAMKPCT